MLHAYISPCPNDTFSFYYFIQSHAHDFHFDFEDIQTLNEKAILGEGDLIKISFALYPQVQKDYIILSSGAALGEGCGPLLIGRKILTPEEICQSPIAVPGKYTTANRLFEFFYPNAKQVYYTTYDQVMADVKSGKAAAGVIIHESRFTYAAHDLMLVSDLGLLWEKNCFPLLPLGGIVAKRSLGTEKINAIVQQLRQSVQWAFQNRTDQKLVSFLKQYAQELDEEVMQSHIQLYVNSFSVDLGERGQDAVCRLLGSQLQDSLKHFT